MQRVHLYCADGDSYSLQGPIRSILVHATNE